MTSIAHQQTSRVVIPVPISRRAEFVRLAREQAAPFDPAGLMAGDRLGWFTLVSDPRQVPGTSRRMHGNFLCSCERKEYPYCSWVPDTWVADVLCICGWVVPDTVLTGDPGTQRIACGKHRCWNLASEDTRRWAANRGALSYQQWLREVAA